MAKKQSYKSRSGTSATTRRSVKRTPAKTRTPAKAILKGTTRAKAPVKAVASATTPRKTPARANALAVRDLVKKEPRQHSRVMHPGAFPRKQPDKRGSPNQLNSASSKDKQTAFSPSSKHSVEAVRLQNSGKKGPPSNGGGNGETASIDEDRSGERSSHLVDSPPKGDHQGSWQLNSFLRSQLSMTRLMLHSTWGMFALQLDLASKFLVHTSFDFDLSTRVPTVAGSQR